MKNKKVVLSVLSAAVVSSMASSAFAAELKNGIYLGGNVDKFYSLSSFFSDANEEQAIAELEQIGGFSKTVFVVDGKAAFLNDYLKNDDAALKDPTPEMFADGPTYKEIDKNGNNVGEFEPVDPTPPPAEELEVESVSAINLHQVAVVFSTEVDKTTAERVSNYSVLAGVDRINSAVLQSDNKTVVLNLFETDDDTAALLQNTDYTLVVENVKTKDGSKTVEKTTKTFKALDSTIPTVSSVEVLGNKALRVTFAEPVQATAAENIANYSFVGETVTIASVDLDKDTVGSETYTQAIINLTDALTPGTHKLRVNGTGAIKDFAGYSVVPQDFTVTVAADTAAPQVSSVVALSRTEVEVTFSEPVDALAAGDVFWNTNGSTTSGKAASSVQKLADNKYKVVFTANPLAVGTVYIVVDNGNVVDYSNNKMATDAKFTVTVTDETKPVVTTVSAKNDKTIEVFFSKAVQNAGTSGSADYEAHYTLMTADGTVLKTSDNAGLDLNGHPVTPIVYSATDKKATLSLGGNALPGGTYKLKVAGVKDSIGQAMDEQVIEFTVTDTTAPTYSSYSASASTLVLNFNEPMATTGEHSITNAANYQVSLGGAAFDSLPTGTELVASSTGKSVTIKLPTGSTFTTNDDINIGFISGGTVKAVADAAGNLLSPTPVSNITVTAAQADIDAAGSTLNITSPTTVELTLPASETKLASVVADDFKFSTTGAANFAAAEIAVESATVDATGKKITFTVSEDDAFTADTASLTLYVDPTPADVDSRDVLGLKILEGATTTLDNNKIQAELKSATVIDENNIRVTFTAKVDDADAAELADDLIVVQGDKTYTGSDLTVTMVPAGGDSNIINIAVGTALDLSQAVTVKTVSEDLLDSHTANGSLIKANTTGVTSTASALAVDTFDFVPGGAAATKASGKITVVNYAQLTGAVAEAATIQVESAVAATGGAGDVVFSIVTANGIKTVTTAVDDGDTANTVAGNIATQIGLDPDITAEFDVDVNGDTVTLTRKVEGDNDIIISEGTHTATFASAGDIAIDAEAVDGVTGDKFTVDSTQFVFVPAGSTLDVAGATEIEIGADEATTGDNIQAEVDALPSVVATDNDAGEVTVEASTAGTAGNSIVLVEDVEANAAALTVTGSGTLTGGSASGASAGAPNSGDRIEITFNRNVDPESILADWDGSSVSLTDLVRFINENDTITFEGANIGTIATAGLDADGVADATIVLSGRTLTITLSESAAVTQSAGTSTFTPSALITSSAGTPVDVNAKARTNNRL